jgi:transcriptional regulator with XRE-family HTH domain
MWRILGVVITPVKGVRVISSLFKKIMKECGLQQKALADLLGVSIDRVKSLTSGRVGKLTREESEALIKKLNIRGDWLATGEGPMLQSPGEQEFQRRLDAIKTATDRVTELGLPTEQARRLSEVLCALEIGDTARLSDLLQDPPASRQRALLDNYENADDVGKKIIEGTASLAAQSAVKKKAG